MRCSILGAGAICLGLAVPTVGSAASYFANIGDLNGFGVSGRASIDHDEAAESLTVRVRASGLTPGEAHPQHIHGRLSLTEEPVKSTSPTLANDLDCDGFIELAEGAFTYGPVLIPLDDEAGNFPVANANGKVKFKRTYDLTDITNFEDGYKMSELLPLSLREVVLHGANVPAGIGLGTAGEVDGTAGYKATLPVGSGEISPVPLPAAAWAMLAGIAALAGVSRRGRRQTA